MHEPAASYRRVFLAAAFALFCASPVCAGSAFATPASLRKAIDAVDLEGLRKEAASGAEAERKLASAIEQAWTHQDDAAIAALTAAIPLQKNMMLKAAGYWQLSSVQSRRGDFAAAISAGEAAKAIGTPGPSALQTLDFMKALAGVAPTRGVGDAKGRAEVTRDLAGLMRSDITVGDTSIGAVLDTGANFSTVTETAAKRMGLRMLNAAVSVGSSSKDVVASKLGVADKLSIGGAEFTNVVFIVLPDKDLSLLGGAYTIDAILGMPVFFEMGRIGTVWQDGQEWFVFGRVPGVSGLGGERNILLNGFSPLVDASIIVDGAARNIRLLLDSGAQKTSLDGRFASEFAALMDGAATSSTLRGGAGGTVLSLDTRKLEKLDLHIAERIVQLKGVAVVKDVNEERYGLLGQDALRGGFTIDFDAGRLELN